MGVEVDLLTLMSGAAGLTALVGDRIYNDQAPEETARPFVVFKLVSENDYSAMGADTGESQSRFQFDCIGDQSDDALDVAAQLKLAMVRKRTGGIQDIFLANQMSLFDAAPLRFRRAVDLMVFYKE